MRKLLLAALLVPLLAYVAMPYWSAWQLRTALKAHDAAALEHRVDWVTLRGNLKATLAANLASEPADGGIASRLRKSLGPYVADKAVDVLVTPKGLTRLMSTGAALGIGPTGRNGGLRSGGGDGGANDTDANDPFAPRRLRWAFFSGPARFRIEVVDVANPARRVVSILALQGVSWRLVDVYYVTP